MAGGQLVGIVLIISLESSLRKAAIEQGHELLGLVYINILLTTYEDELERIFLEIYAPVK